MQGERRCKTRSCGAAAAALMATDGQTGRRRAGAVFGFLTLPVPEKFGFRISAIEWMWLLVVVLCINGGVADTLLAEY